MRKFLTLLLASLGMMSVPGWAQRQPVLPQIDLPHAYYYRELYLPQLTSGPSSLSWSPDSRRVAWISNRDGENGIYVVEVGK